MRRRKRGEERGGGGRRRRRKERGSKRVMQLYARYRMEKQSVAYYIEKKQSN